MAPGPEVDPAADRTGPVAPPAGDAPQGSAPWARQASTPAASAPTAGQSVNPLTGQASDQRAEGGQSVPGTQDNAPHPAPGTPTGQQAGPWAGQPAGQPTGTWAGQPAGSWTGQGTGAGQWQPPAPRQESPPRPRDPVAVAVGNASLFGVGYLLLGKRLLGIGAAAVSVVLLVLLTTAARTLWFEVVVLVWWLAVIAHGWFLARRGGATTAVRKQRITALAFAAPVLLVFALLRFDAARIEGDTLDALAVGECAQARDSVDGLWFGHRLADAPLTVRGEATVTACGLVDNARSRLGTALSGDTTALQAGLANLATVLADLPGHEKAVEVVLDGFLAGLPTSVGCDTAAVTDALGKREVSNTALDRARDVVPEVAPAALLACGGELMAASKWPDARVRYQQLLTEYPGHELTAKAEEGVKQATLAIELANVRGLLRSTGSSSQPAYCKTPAAYSAAPPYATSNRSVMVGNDAYAARLPQAWLTADPVDATAVICAGAEEFGATVETCRYVPEGGAPYPVAFRKIAIPVRVFELRTGKLVADTRVEIAGTSCPEFVSVERGVDPPRERYVEAADGNVHDAFRPLIVP